MLSPRISSWSIFLDLGFIVLVNLLLLSVCSTQADVKNASDQSHLEKKTHRSHLNNETAPIPIVKEIGHFLSWFFGVPEDERNSTTKFNSSVPESSTFRSTSINNRSTDLPTAKLTRREEEVPQRRLQVVPRFIRRVNSSSPSGRQIQITDIQTSIGTELAEGNGDEDPSQINLQDELESIDKFERKVAQDYDTNDDKKQRSKRDLPIHGIQRPYLNPGNAHLQRNFASRQGLLFNPAQHVLALQQQQAAALLQQQALQQGVGYRRPYFYDDYDDSDYDDSDSLEDDDTMGFFNPVRDGMRRGQFFPPGVPPIPPYMGGIGRRSVDAQLTKAHPSDDIEQMVESPALKVKTPRKHSSGPLRRDGEWTLIDDYDLSSDFHKSRKGFPFLKSRQDQLDEHENENSIKRGGLQWGQGKPSNGRRFAKQDGNETTTTASPGNSSTTPETPPNIGGTLSTVGGGLSTLAPGGSSSLPELTTPSPEGNSSMNPLPTSLPINSTLSSTTPSTITNSTNTNSTTLTPSQNTTESTTAQPMGQKPPYKANANCRCGAQSVRGEMITRGTVIRVHTNPWLFAISNKNKHLCSGTLINNRYILTAAQCVEGVNKKQLTVMGGLATKASQNFTVSRVIIHPNYSPMDSTANDLALLRLNNAVGINQMMRPICLPLSARSRAQVPSSGTLTTWIQKSSQLQMVQTDVKVLDQSKCNSSVHDFSRGQLCTSPPGKTSCGGDSGGRGGSLQANSADYSYDQIGVVTSTIGCRTDNSPGVYTDIRNYTRWILTQTKDARYCNKPKIKPMDLSSLVDIQSRSEIDEEEEEEEEEDDFDNLF